MFFALIVPMIMAIMPKWRPLGWLSALFQFVLAVMFVFQTEYQGFDLLLPWETSISEISRVFLILIFFIGFAVQLFSFGYFDEIDGQRFRRMANAFSAAMTGVVCSDNLLAMFIFWELTGILSFFLISFDPKSDLAPAKRALWLTTTTSMFLLFGIVQLRSHDVLLLSQISSELLLDPKIAIPLLIGAFGKSAQFPLQFWLPGSMTAPSPASAYLHSATMVKLGVFLVMSLPFAHQNVFYAVCVPTVLIGSLLSLGCKDFKASFAHSTVAQLGLLMFYYGTGGQSLWPVAVHALYKAGWFLWVGAVDHVQGKRDVTALRDGLPLPYAVLAFVLMWCTLALPGTWAVLAKSELGGLPLYVTLPPSIAAALLTSYIVSNIKIAVKTKAYLLDIIVLTLLVIASFAGAYFTESPLIDSKSFGIAALSFLFVYFLKQRVFSFSDWGVFQWQRAVDFLWQSVRYAGGKIAHLDNLFSLHLLIISAVVVAILSGSLVWSMPGIVAILFSELTESFQFRLDQLVIAVSVLALSFLIYFSYSRMVRVFAMSALGLMLAIYFVILRAPDLALTQFVIEAAVIIPLILFLLTIPQKPFLMLKSFLTVKFFVSLGFGVLMASLSLLSLSRGFEKIGSQFLDLTMPFAFGSNAVNTILVDFRGVDTLFEATVLFIALLGVRELLKVKA